DRRDHRDEPVLDRLVQGELQQRELEQRTDPGQVVEPAAGHLGAALDIDRADPFADLHVVARRRQVGELADLAEYHVVVHAAGRCAVLHHVGYRQLRGPQRRLGPVDRPREVALVQRLQRRDGQLPLTVRPEGGPVLGGGGGRRRGGRGGRRRGGRGDRGRAGGHGGPGEPGEAGGGHRARRKQQDA